MQEQMTSQKLYEMEPLEGYETMDFEEKNATKFMSTFPFPYMNGHLHLGKSQSNQRPFLSCLESHNDPSF